MRDSPVNIRLIKDLFYTEREAPQTKRPLVVVEISYPAVAKYKLSFPAVTDTEKPLSGMVVVCCTLFTVLDSDEVEYVANTLTVADNPVRMSDSTVPVALSLLNQPPWVTVTVQVKLAYPSVPPEERPLTTSQPVLVVLPPSGSVMVAAFAGTAMLAIVNNITAQRKMDVSFLVLILLSHPWLIGPQCVCMRTPAPLMVCRETLYARIHGVFLRLRNLLLQL